MASSAPSFPVPSVLGNLQNTEANLEALAGKSLNVEDIFVEEELEVKREEEEKGKEDMMGKSGIEEDLKDNKIFTDVKGFFNPQSRALQVFSLLLIGRKPVFFWIWFRIDQRL
jgi:hypothetical protein